MSHREPKLNAGLDVRKLKIRVPEHCLSLAQGQYATEIYAAELRRQENEDGCENLTLEGDLAVAYARVVHAAIKRQVLRYDQVSAVDIGFAVEEQSKRFLNTLAIRVHVARKHPIAYLVKEGLPDFTSLSYVPMLRTVIAKGRSEGWPPEKHRAEVAEVIRDRSRAYGVNLREECLRRCLDCLVDGLEGNHCRAYPIAGLTDDDLGLHVDRIPVPSTFGRPEARLREGRSESECSCGCHREVESSSPACDCCQSVEPCESCGEDGDCRCVCRLRLTVCGVPLDIVDANYFPSIHHASGSDQSGVYVDPLRGSKQLDDKDALFTGRGRIDPLVGGVSVGSARGQAGTLGTIVWDQLDGSPCMLSNWHVLAGSPAAQAGSPVYQPATFDGGSEEDVAAHLKRWHLGTLGDAAIAELDRSRNYSSGEILGMWHPLSGYREPRLNLEIRKWGRTTGFTQGFIDGIALATNITYAPGLVRHFDNQFHIAPLESGKDVSRVGDSGSLVVTAVDVDDLETIAQGLIDERREVLDEIFEDLNGDDRDLSKVAACVRRVLERRSKRIPSLEKELDRLEKEDSLTLKEVARLRHEARFPEEHFGKRASKAPKKLRVLKRLLFEVLEAKGVGVGEYARRLRDRRNREVRRAYYAVGIIFAGDTPGSPFGEFALASDLQPLADDLRFSLRPVYQSRNSFREVQTRPALAARNDFLPSGRILQPRALSADSRDRGPQPDGRNVEPDTGDG